jgi:hypothetical protein
MLHLWVGLRILIKNTAESYATGKQGATLLNLKRGAGRQVCGPYTNTAGMILINKRYEN